MFWIAALVVFMLARRGTRASVRDALRAACSPKILVLVIVLAAWVIGLVYGASEAGLWSGDRVTDTAFWFVTAGLVLFGRFDKVSEEPHFLRRAALATLELSAL